MNTSGFKALLVAAGVGSRLRPLTDVLPKCLMPINGRPLLGIWLDMLSRGGVTEVVVNLHHHADLVRDYLRRGPYADLVTPVFEPQLLGTGGTLLNNRDRLTGGSLFFAHADNLSIFDLRALITAHHDRPPGTAMTMMTFDAEEPRQCGIVERDSRGIVIGFHEKSSNPPGSVANAAVFMLESEVVDFVGSLGRPFVEFSTDVIPHFIGRIATFHNGTYHRDIGSLASLLRAQIEYPIVGTEHPADPGNDPWFGLMRESHGDLARLLLQRLGEALRDSMK